MNASPAVDGVVVELCAVLGDETRWQILTLLGARAASASELSRELPVSRQAIAKHLELLAQVGLAERERAGREVRYRALGSRLTELAEQLETIGRGWDVRLARLKDVAESLPQE
ncbi:MAG TPA: metalloregulator ArsR/SmtB family transcription factor [Candidatus Ruania gallistercoris]|uniref:Metalloregulator ArsR/SmtB family transcription factor n=1 Tax=Candidatus Ruania gallistercoris TaxID=2838746 RepID=A0A9D2EH93_9MICO|nr:metalloregulator ArsR/SmtB family transcription factor [Candidatus Ruania gallistercoris]